MGPFCFFSIVGRMALSYRRHNRRTRNANGNLLLAHWCACEASARHSLANCTNLRMFELWSERRPDTTADGGPPIGALDMCAPLRKRDDRAIS